jgi:hypothetical protein
MKTYKILLFILISISLTSCGIPSKNQGNLMDSLTVVDGSVTRDTIINSTPFLKNTTYTYRGSFQPSNLRLLDLSYTPYAKYKLDCITVKLNLNTKVAIVTTNGIHKHIIKSIIYSKMTQYHKDKNGVIKLADESYNMNRASAVITTNKGTIIITEPDISMSSSNEYKIIVEYGNFIAGDDVTILEMAQLKE